jgi:hypothetical protein
MKKLVLLVMLAMFLVSVSAPVWATVPVDGKVVYQGPPEPPK